MSKSKLDEELNTTISGIIELLETKDLNPAPGLGKIERDFTEKDLLRTIKTFGISLKNKLNKIDTEQKKILIEKLDEFHSDLFTWQPQSYLAQKQYQKTYNLIVFLEKFSPGKSTNKVPGVKKRDNITIVDNIIKDITNGLTTNEDQIANLKKDLLFTLSQLDPDYVKTNTKQLTQEIIKNLQKKQGNITRLQNKFRINSKESKAVAKIITAKYLPLSNKYTKTAISGLMLHSGLKEGLTKINEPELKTRLAKFIIKHAPKSKLDPHNISENNLLEIRKINPGEFDKVISKKVGTPAKESEKISSRNERYNECLDKIIADIQKSTYITKATKEKIRKNLLPALSELEPEYAMNISAEISKSLKAKRTVWSSFFSDKFSIGAKDIQNIAKNIAEKHLAKSNKVVINDIHSSLARKELSKEGTDSKIREHMSEFLSSKYAGKNTLNPMNISDRDLIEARKLNPAAFDKIVLGKVATKKRNLSKSVERDINNEFSKCCKDIIESLEQKQRKSLSTERKEKIELYVIPGLKDLDSKYIKENNVAEEIASAIKKERGSIRAFRPVKETSTLKTIARRIVKKHQDKSNYFVKNYIINNRNRYDQKFENRVYEFFDEINVPRNTLDSHKNSAGSITLDYLVEVRKLNPEIFDKKVLKASYDTRTSKQLPKAKLESNVSLPTVEEIAEKHDENYQQKIKPENDPYKEYNELKKSQKSNTMKLENYIKGKEFGANRKKDLKELVKNTLKSPKKRRASIASLPHSKLKRKSSSSRRGSF